MRMLEDRSCPKYPRCFNKAAFDKTNDKYIPCYECMGGKHMSQVFFCPNPKCKTSWTPDNNDWAISKFVTCPFCNRTSIVTVSMKDGKLFGEIFHGSTTK